VQRRAYAGRALFFDESGLARTSRERPVVAALRAGRCKTMRSARLSVMARSGTLIVSPVSNASRSRSSTRPLIASHRFRISLTRFGSASSRLERMLRTSVYQHRSGCRCVSRGRLWLSDRWPSNVEFGSSTIGLRKRAPSAKAMHDPKARRSMLLMAASYDRMAEHLEIAAEHLALPVMSSPQLCP